MKEKLVYVKSSDTQETFMWRGEPLYSIRRVIDYEYPKDVVRWETWNEITGKRRIGSTYKLDAKKHARMFALRLAREIG